MTRAAIHSIQETPQKDARNSQSLFSEARKFSGQLEEAGTSDWGESLSGVLKKVTLGAGQIRLRISRLGLMACLGASSNSSSVSNKAYRKGSETPERKRHSLSLWIENQRMPEHLAVQRVLCEGYPAVEICCAHLSHSLVSINEC
jgi:hypothetical protein